MSQVYRPRKKPSMKREAPETIAGASHNEPVRDSGALEVFLFEYRSLLSRKNAITVLNRTLCITTLALAAMSNKTGVVLFVGLTVALSAVWLTEIFSISTRVSRIGKSIVQFHPKHDDLYILLTFPDHYANMTNMLLRLEAMLWVGIAVGIVLFKIFNGPVIVDVGKLM